MLVLLSGHMCEISIKHHSEPLSNAVLSLFFFFKYIVPHLHARLGHHYSSSHPQHQARSIIFLENHYGCVFPWGRCKVGENRSGGMMVSSDLITSGAEPDSEKWFLVLSVSLCSIHDGTKIAVMNSWHWKFIIFSFWILSVKSGCNFCICAQNEVQVPGHIQYFTLRSLWGSNQMLLIFILIIINRHHSHIWLW